MVGSDEDEPHLMCKADFETSSVVSNGDHPGVLEEHSARSLVVEWSALSRVAFVLAGSTSYIAS